MLELKPKTNGSLKGKTTAENQQPRKLAIALALLLVTFVALIMHDRQFWFGTNEVQDGDLAQLEAARQTTAKAAPSAAVRSKPATPAAKKPVATAKNSPKPTAPTTVATNRTALPPLDVEVIGGNSQRTVRPGSNATKVEIVNPKTSSNFTAKIETPTNAAKLERMSPHPLFGSFDGSYPLLAQQMKVQGSVVLQALIGADGIIENLRVLSGPGILASAARQAVREWRFKPYLQNGQALESKATITVNFTINVADGTTTTASLTPSTLTITQLGE